MDSKVDIGILDKKDNWLLHPRFFPSKVGGKPAWLDLQNLCSPNEFNCNICQDPMIFLCQVYAPYEECSDCFHRTLFVFICKNASCSRTNLNENLLVLRCQLPRKNNIYSFEPSKEDENEHFPMDCWPKLCIICGVKGPSHCSKCKKVYYCSRKHQILDWQNGHKQLCNELQNKEVVNQFNFIPTVGGKTLLFDEWELIVDEEDEEDSKPEFDANNEMTKYDEMAKNKKIGSLNNVSEEEMEQYANRAQNDKTFNIFKKRIARCPDQILRYDKGGTPLWVTDTTSLNNPIPKCQYCNGDRQFEFQIMPQLLNYLKAGSELQSIDWGVLAIYTCKKSCNEGPTYKVEFVIKQDFI